MSKIIPKGICVYFPHVPLHVRPNSNFVTSKGVITFNTHPSQTKYEIRQYLEKVYNVGVIKVNTQIYAGKWKRDAKRFLRKRRAFKKAIVTVDNSLLLQQLAGETDSSEKPQIQSSKRDE